MAMYADVLLHLREDEGAELTLCERPMFVFGSVVTLERWGDGVGYWPGLCWPCQGKMAERLNSKGS